VDKNYKMCLHEWTQKNSLKPPDYSYDSKGLSQQLRDRCIIEVCNKTFQSQRHSRKKNAQDATKLAYEILVAIYDRHDVHKNLLVPNVLFPTYARKAFCSKRKLS
jgi:hypothetical protein